MCASGSAVCASGSAVCTLRGAGWGWCGHSCATSHSPLKPAVREDDTSAVLPQRPLQHARELGVPPPHVCVLAAVPAVGGGDAWRLLPAHEAAHHLAERIERCVDCTALELVQVEEAGRGGGGARGIEREQEGEHRERAQGGRRVLRKRSCMQNETRASPGIESSPAAADRRVSSAGAETTSASPSH